MFSTEGLGQHRLRMRRREAELGAPGGAGMGIFPLMAVQTERIKNNSVPQTYKNHDHPQKIPENEPVGPRWHGRVGLSPVSLAVPSRTLPFRVIN